MRGFFFYFFEFFFEFFLILVFFFCLFGVWYSVHHRFGSFFGIYPGKADWRVWFWLNLVIGGEFFVILFYLFLIHFSFCLFFLLLLIFIYFLNYFLVGHYRFWNVFCYLLLLLLLYFIFFWLFFVFLGLVSLDWNLPSLYF